MANKRQRKKQAAKQTKSLLLKSGLSEKQADRLKNRPIDEVKSLPNVKAYERKKKQQERQQARNQRAKDRRAELKGLTGDSKLITSLTYASEDRYQKELKRLKRNAAQRERYKEKKAIPKKQILILWRDQTEASIGNVPAELKKEHDGDSLELLILGINEQKRLMQGEIGETEIHTTDNPQKIISYYSPKNMDWGNKAGVDFDPYYMPVYTGTGSNYYQLILSVFSTVMCLYQVGDKYHFLNTLGNHLKRINETAYKRFRKDILNKWLKFTLDLKRRT